MFPAQNDQVLVNSHHLHDLDQNYKNKLVKLQKKQSHHVQKTFDST